MQRVYVEIQQCRHTQGRIQDFKLGGALKKKSRLGAKIFGVFRVKNHDFMQKKKKKKINFRGERAGCAPSWIRPWCQYSYIQW